MKLYDSATPLSGGVAQPYGSHKPCPQLLLQAAVSGSLEVLWVHVVGCTGCALIKRKGGFEKHPRYKASTICE